MRKSVPEDFVPNPHQRASIVPEVMPTVPCPTERRTRSTVSFFKSLRSRGDILDPSKICVADAVPRRARRTSGFNQRSSISMFVRPVLPSRASMSEIPSFFAPSKSSSKPKKEKKQKTNTKNVLPKTPRANPPATSSSSRTPLASAKSQSKAKTNAKNDVLKPPGAPAEEKRLSTTLQARAKKRAQRPSWLTFGAGSKKPPWDFIAVTWFENYYVTLKF